MSARKVDRQTETQIVAMLARGDTRQQIVNWLKTEKGIDFSTDGVSRIKRVNAQTLEFMTSELVKHQATTAKATLNKSRILIEKRLDKAMQLDNELQRLKNKFESGEITSEDYYRQFDTIMRHQLTIQELNSVSKESFHQSQLEANRPTAITESPEQAKENLKTLLQAIAEGDVNKLVKGLFIE